MGDSIWVKAVGGAFGVANDFVGQCFFILAISQAKKSVNRLKVL